MTAVAIGTAQTISGWNYYSVYWRTDVRGASILIGALAFLIVRDRNLRLPSWAAPLLGVLGVAINTNTIPDPIKYSLGTSALAFALACLPHTASVLRDTLERQTLLTAGFFSYSIYLYQQPFYALSGDLAARLFHLSLAIVAALCSFYLIERPSRVSINRWIDRVTFRAKNELAEIERGEDRLAF
jgi:peptidoglycan/LPS O-acetylase OafA/YrhL